MSLICTNNDLSALSKNDPGMSTPPVDNLAENPSSTAKKVKKIGGARILPNNYANYNQLFFNDFFLKARNDNCIQRVTTCFRTKVEIFQKSC
jgi:hypothetical protein